MGIFDASQFEPQTYGGGTGILPPWLEQILANGPLSAQATQPQQQMPLPSQLRTMPVSLPREEELNARPQPQPQPQPQYGMPAQAPPSPPSVGLGDRIGAGLQGVFNAGSPLQSIGNLFSGLATGQRADPMGIALRQQEEGQRAIYQAARQGGLTHEQGVAMALNPDVFKQLTPTFGKIGSGLFGDEMGFINSQTQTVKKPGEVSGVAAPNPEALITQVQAARAKGVPTEEIYKMIPPSIQEDVRAMLESRAIPANLGRGNSQLKSVLLTLAHTIDPTFSETELPGRVAAMKSWMSGKDAETVRNLRQTLYHGSEELLKAFDNLGNTQYPAINAIGNLYSEKVAGKAGVPDFKMNAHAFASELSKIYKQANLSDSEINAWEASIGPNLSPEQQQAVMRKAGGLLEGGLRGLQQKRLEGIGPVADAKLPPIVGPEQEKLIAQMNGWVPKSLQNAPATPAKSSEAPSVSTPPAAAIQALRADPKLIPQFETKYGKDSAQKYLNQRPQLQM